MLRNKVNGIVTSLIYIVAFKKSIFCLFFSKIKNSTIFWHVSFTSIYLWSILTHKNKFLFWLWPSMWCLPSFFVFRRKLILTQHPVIYPALWHSPWIYHFVSFYFLKWREMIWLGLWQIYIKYRKMCNNDLMTFFC